MEKEISSELPQSADGGPSVGRAAGKQEQVGVSDRQRPNRTLSRIVQIVSVVILLLLLVLLWRFLGDRASPKAAGRGEVVPVEMAAVTQKDVPIQIRAIGNVEALSTIAVRSQVEGVLQRVAFTPGQEVKKGDLLF